MRYKYFNKLNYFFKGKNNYFNNKIIFNEINVLFFIIS